MSIRVGIVMDPLSTVNVKKDSTYAMMREIHSRGWELWIMLQGDLFMRDGDVFGHMRRYHIHDGQSDWYELAEEACQPLTALQALLMRKDPPFDMEFIYTTYLLERAEEKGVLVVNKPQSLRDANEKLYTAWFPECCPPTLVTRRADDIHRFLEEHPLSILKPPDGMGGKSIFQLQKDDPNRNVILETLTEQGTRFVMVQKYIPEITKGDKRILLVNGEVVPYALARIPPEDDFRGNIAVGGTAVGQELSERDRWICEQISSTLREKGLMFVGIDVIGDYMTEINVTSPTGIRELDRDFGCNIAGLLMDAIQQKLEES